MFDLSFFIMISLVIISFNFISSLQSEVKLLKEEIAILKEKLNVD